MQLINLKCSLAPQQITNCLKYYPQIVELQLFEKDIYEPQRIVLGDLQD